MGLIRLNQVPHPDLNCGMPMPIYVDASRIMTIARGHQQYPKIGSVEKKQDLAIRLYYAACNLLDHVGAYTPKMDDPVAVEWMATARSVAGEVNNAYQKWSYASRETDFHPREECTEIQLACGTALEHGVMLARVWVMESPAEVADAIAANIRSNQ